MAGLHVRCESSGRTWRLEVVSSLFLELNVLGQPCPFCEAYTLQCSAADDVHDCAETYVARGGNGSPPGSTLGNIPAELESGTRHRVAAARRRLPLRR
jgi:hypothetical protein